MPTADVAAEPSWAHRAAGEPNLDRPARRCHCCGPGRAVTMMMGLEQVIAKYTGHHVTHRQLEMAMRGGGLTAELAMGIGSTAEAVRATENELIRVCDAINRHTATAVQVITADAGQPHRQPSRLDELQNAGVRFDALLAVRSAQLAHLHRLLQLGRPLPSVDVSQPGPPR